MWRTGRAGEVPCVACPRSEVGSRHFKAVPESGSVPSAVSSLLPFLAVAKANSPCSTLRPSMPWASSIATAIVLEKSGISRAGRALSHLSRLEVPDLFLATKKCRQVDEQNRLGQLSRSTLMPAHWKEKRFLLFIAVCAQ